MTQTIRNSTKRKWLPVLILLIGLLGFGLRANAALSLNSIKTAAAGKFVKSDSGAWYYQYKDGSYAKNTLLKIKGKIYYFSKQGYRFYDWKKIKGQQYYFGTRDQGYMYLNKWVKTKKGNYYYLLKDGTTAKGLQKINKKYFLFNKKTGVNMSGWQKVNGKRYYFGTHDASWVRRKMLVKTGNDTYYVKADGTPATGWVTTGGHKYYFGKNFKAYKGRHKVGGTTYYFGSDGKLISQGADLTVSSECAYLYDMTAKKVLYDKNGDMKHSNASTTKIMTCLLALENCKTSDVVKVSSAAASVEPTKMYLHAGEKIKVKDLLFGLMLPSGNDAAIALAEHISGSTSKFAQLMNKRAKELGCTHTHFVTPNGLDAGLDHYTSAHDLCTITAYAMKNSSFRLLARTRNYSCTSVSGYSYNLYTTNALWGTVPGLMGVKTGFTNKAGYCFVGAVKGSNGHYYISVTLGAPSGPDRWTDSAKLLNYAYKLK